jgi:hypothetical protein
MRTNVINIMLAGAALLAADTVSAKAADTLVTCDTPIAEVNTGHDGTSPRFTIQCTGGSSAGVITYFAYEIKASPNVAQMLSRSFETFLLQNPTGAAIRILSNLSDTSGAAWGCGGANCRIIDYLPGT